MPVFRIGGSLFQEVSAQEVRDLVDPRDVRAVFLDGELLLIARRTGELVRVAAVPPQAGEGARLGYFLRNPVSLLAITRRLEALRAPRGKAESVA